MENETVHRVDSKRKRLIVVLLLVLIVVVAGLAASPYNPETSLQQTIKAAEQGDAGAQVNLGFMYGNGQGIPQNYVKAYYKTFRIQIIII